MLYNVRRLPYETPAINCHLLTLLGIDMVRTASLGIRIEPEVKAALEEAARGDRRSVAQYVELLIIKDLQRKGLLEKT
jgi:hypothetical protein